MTDWKSPRKIVSKYAKNKSVHRTSGKLILLPTAKLHLAVELCVTYIKSSISFYFKIDGRRVAPALKKKIGAYRRDANTGMP